MAKAEDGTQGGRICWSCWTLHHIDHKRHGYAAPLSLSLSLPHPHTPLHPPSPTPTLSLQGHFLPATLNANKAVKMSIIHSCLRDS